MLGKNPRAGFSFVCGCLIFHYCDDIFFLTVSHREPICDEVVNPSLVSFQRKLASAFRQILFWEPEGQDLSED